MKGPVAALEIEHSGFEIEVVPVVDNPPDAANPLESKDVHIHERPNCNTGEHSRCTGVHSGFEIEVEPAVDNPPAAANPHEFKDVYVHESPNCSTAEDSGCTRVHSGFEIEIEPVVDNPPDAANPPKFKDVYIHESPSCSTREHSGCTGVHSGFEIEVFPIMDNPPDAANPPEFKDVYVHKRPSCGTGEHSGCTRVHSGYEMEVLPIVDNSPNAANPPEFKDVYVRERPNCGTGEHSGCTGVHSGFETEVVPIVDNLPDAANPPEFKVGISDFSLTKTDSSKPSEFKGKATSNVIIYWLIVLFGGLILGYDIGILGVLTLSEDFLWDLLYPTMMDKRNAKETNYCKYNNPLLQLLTSSLYLVALLSGFVSVWLSSKWGRRLILWIASPSFLVGIFLNAAAKKLSMWILGRVFLGIGIGLYSQVIPLFISEIPPSKAQDAMNIGFQVANTTGILLASVSSSLFLRLHTYGWRFSIGIMGVPLLFLLGCSFFISETPRSLLLRGKLERGKAALKKIRGLEDVDAEFNKILMDSTAIKNVKNPFKEILKPTYRPALVISFLVQIFQQFTGTVAIIFYGPILFQSIGFSDNASLISSVILLAANIFGTVLSIYLIKKLGRRRLVLAASIFMLISELTIGAFLHDLGPHDLLQRTKAIFAVVLGCVYLLCFACSSGPLGWLSEMFPAETEVVGMILTTSFNTILSFMMAHVSLSIMCRMGYKVFFFFAGFIFLLATIAFIVIPETTNVLPDEMVERVWKKHWFWKRYFR